MYQSKKSIQKKALPALKKYFLKYLNQHSKIYCSAVKRPVFFDKQPDAILKRKDVKYRLEAFYVGIDILRHSKNIVLWKKDGQNGISLQGLSKESEIVTVHVREEISADKNRRLFFISSFHKQR